MSDSCVYQCQKLCFLHRQLTFLAFSSLTEVRLHDALLIPTRHTRAIDAEELKAHQQSPFQEIITYRFKYHPHDSRAKERNTKHQLSPCLCLSRLLHFLHSLWETVLPTCYQAQPENAVTCTQWKYSANLQLHSCVLGLR